MTYNEFRWQWVFGVAIILALLQVPSSDGVDRGQERNMQAIKFLNEIGEKLSCALTVEIREVTRERKDFFSHRFPESAIKEIETVDDFAAYIKKLELNTIVWKNEQINAIHLVDEEIDKQEDWPLQEQITMRFEGTRRELLAQLHKKIPRVIYPYAMSTIEQSLVDLNAPVSIDVKELSVRSALCVATGEGRTGLIWIARTKVNENAGGIRILFMRAKKDIKTEAPRENEDRNGADTNEDAPQ